MAAVSRMSHDLNTPINAITGFSRVILTGIDGAIEDLQREDLMSIDEAGCKLLTLVDEVFSVARSEISKAEP